MSAVSVRPDDKNQSGSCGDYIDSKIALPVSVRHRDEKTVDVIDRGKGDFY